MAGSPSKRVDQRAQAFASKLGGKADSPHAQVLSAVSRGMGAGPLRTALPELRERLNEPFPETEHGDTLLSLAARHDNTEAARFLLQEGANPDAPTKDGATSPLFIAVCGAHTPRLVHPRASP
jgi:ankyrin repeat protein